MIEAQRPDRFTTDFLENVLKVTGGAARATIPILKRAGFLASDGTPTDLYARFKTESGRGQAALQALRAGFSEIFKRSEYAHTAEPGKLQDFVVEITGLVKNDPVTRAIQNTCNVFKNYIPAGVRLPEPSDETAASPPPRLTKQAQEEEDSPLDAIRLAYNINIVLPETSDLSALNAIFRSIKENLLR